MSQKQAREMLFKNGRPVFRQMEQEDVRWFWAAHKVEHKPDMDPEDFYDYIAKEMEPYEKAYIAEDVNAQFSTGLGPIGVIAANYDGWNLTPHVAFFPWATKRNKVRVTVGFLMKQRFQKDVGCIRIHTTETFRKFFSRVSKYVPIKSCGKIEGGRPDGEWDYIFYVRGKRQH
jgi:hypothetical protein